MIAWNLEFVHFVDPPTVTAMGIVIPRVMPPRCGASYFGAYLSSDRKLVTCPSCLRRLS